MKITNVETKEQADARIIVTCLVDGKPFARELSRPEYDSIADFTDRFGIDGGLYKYIAKEVEASEATSNSEDAIDGLDEETI